MFKSIADYIVSYFGLSLETKFGAAVHFFIEDSVKIFILIYLTTFIVSLFRTKLDPERIKEYISGKSRWIAYFIAVFLGVITPFCSCSSIPLFIGFVGVGVPFGVAMAFLIASPLISEVAIAMLFTLEENGAQIAFAYTSIGVIISVIGGYLCDKYELGKHVVSVAAKKPCCCSCQKEKVASHSVGAVYVPDTSIYRYAHLYASEVIKDIGLYVLIGLSFGAFMHGYVPQDFFIKYAGAGNIYSVPFAAIAGIPIYANHLSVLPIIEVLLSKGVPVGTSLVMLMSITAISLPEMVMIRKVINWKMIGIFALFLLVSFVIVGYFINWIFV